jgi:hypothetical protein
MSAFPSAAKLHIQASWPTFEVSRRILDHVGQALRAYSASGTSFDPRRTSRMERGSLTAGVFPCQTQLTERGNSKLTEKE